MTPEDFLEKVIAEGGIFPALEYGLSERDLDDSDPDLKENWRELRHAYEDLQGLVKRIEDKIWEYDAYL